MHALFTTDVKECIEVINSLLMCYVVQNGRRVFSEVKTFLKRQSNKNATYVTMTTEQGNQVTMSGNHLLFVSTSNMSAEMKTRYIVGV